MVMSMWWLPSHSLSQPLHHGREQPDHQHRLCRSSSLDPAAWWVHTLSLLSMDMSAAKTAQKLCIHFTGNLGQLGGRGKLATMALKQG
jgi:hypothetical protein